MTKPLFEAKSKETGLQVVGYPVAIADRFFLLKAGCGHLCPDGTVLFERESVQEVHENTLAPLLPQNSRKRLIRGNGAVADYLGISVRSLQTLNAQGLSVARTQFNRIVYYDLDKVDEWISTAGCLIRTFKTNIYEHSNSSTTSGATRL